MISAELVKKLKSADYEGEFDLESMIKECGKEFWKLSRFTSGNWWAKTIKEEKDCCGKTPEEAVAKLLLKLLKK